MVKYYLTIDHDMKYSQSSGQMAPQINRENVLPVHANLTRTFTDNTQQNKNVHSDATIRTEFSFGDKTCQENEQGIQVLNDDRKNIPAEQLPNEQKDRNWNKRTKQYLIPYQQIDLIYEYSIHRMCKKEISERLGYNYSTVLSVIKAYQEKGRIFKFLPFHSKQFLLKHRAQCLKSQKLYRKYRKNFEDNEANLMKARALSKRPGYRWVDDQITQTDETSVSQSSTLKEDRDQVFYPKAKLQLFFNEEDKTILRPRPAAFNNTDDDNSITDRKGFYTEMNFTDSNQDVEKSVIDMYSNVSGSGESSDLYFTKPLYQFNLPLIKDSWVNQEQDCLKLPKPQQS